MRRDAHAAREREGSWEGDPGELTSRLEQIEWRLRSAVDRRPAATLAAAAAAGFALSYLPTRWLVGVLALGARALTPVALRRLDAALFGEPTMDEPRRRTQ
jgi:hypothetical protein